MVGQFQPDSAASTTRTQLARPEPSVDSAHFSRAPALFVAESTGELAPPGVADRACQTPVAERARDVQVLDLGTPALGAAFIDVDVTSIVDIEPPERTAFVV